MEFTNPHTAALQLGLRDGMKVADLGAGSGHYAFAAAAMVGEQGYVYAVDVQEDMMIRLKDDIARKGFPNIDTIWGNIEKPGGTTLKDASIDAVILSNTLFQLEEKNAAITEILRILKPGGKLLLIDWADTFGGIGPAAEHVLREEDAEALFIGSGFTKVKAFRAGPHHYSIVFTAPTV